MVFEQKVFTALRFPYMISMCFSLMTLQTSIGKVPHTHNELIRRIITFECEKLLLTKSPQNKKASNIVITGKKKIKSDILHTPGAFWDKVTGFTDELAVRCDSPAVKNASLDDGDNDDYK